MVCIGEPAHEPTLWCVSMNQQMAHFTVCTGESAHDSLYGVYNEICQAREWGSLIRVDEV